MKARRLCPLLVLFPGWAEAHLVTTGLGPVYDGIGHFFLSLETLLPVLALVLLAALGGPVFARRAALALVGAWAAGVALAVAVPGDLSETEVGQGTAMVLLTSGVLVALERAQGSIVLALLGGLWLGAAEGHALAQMADGGLMLLGSYVSLLVATSLVAGGALALARSGTLPRLAIRVAGSWLAGIGLLMLGWSWRGGAGG